VIKVDKRIVGPEPLSEILAGDNLTALFQQDSENSTRLFLKLDFSALLPEFTCTQINLIYAKPDEL
jgi:hypothetical protein